MIYDEDYLVRCPKCGRQYRGIYTDGYVYYHGCACGFDDLVYNSDILEDGQ